MPETYQIQDDVAETMLITLYIRAQESKRPDGLVKDPQAEALVEKIDYDFSRIEQMQMDDADRTTLIMRSREFDRYAQGFLSRFSDAVVVHIGCGLDTRFDRIDNGQVEWYDLDLPEVIALRQRWIGGAADRYHHLSFSVFDDAWHSQVRKHPAGAYLFLAEGVFMYFTENQIKTLVLTLQRAFPGADLVFDAYTPFLVRMNNLRMRLSRYDARYHFGLKRGEDLESWAPGIRLLSQWSYFDEAEPRLDSFRWMQHVPFLARVISIFHYRLGRLKF